MPTDMFMNIVLNFGGIWRWSPRWLWPISNGMTHQQEHAGSKTGSGKNGAD